MHPLCHTELHSQRKVQVNTQNIVLITHNTTIHFKLKDSDYNVGMTVRLFQKRKIQEDDMQRNYVMLKLIQLNTTFY